jgi:hypothetical protein
LRLKCTKTHLRAYKGTKQFFRLAIARHQGKGKEGWEGGEGRGGEGREGEREDTARPMEIPGYAAVAKVTEVQVTVGDVLRSNSQDTGDGPETFVTGTETVFGAVLKVLLSTK